MPLCARFAAATLLAFSFAAAHADSFNVTVSEGLTNGMAFDTANGNPFSGANTASASFTYTGLINFDNTAPQNGPGKPGDSNSAFGFSTSNVSNYSGSGRVNFNGSNVANFNTLNGFLTSSGSSSGLDYGSFYTFDLGNLSAGTILSVTHDDGISIFQGGTRVGNTVSGATSKVTDVVTLTNSGDTMLYYARENGTPSILEVSKTSVTPEPTSIALLGTGLLSLGGMIRRRRA